MDTSTSWVTETELDRYEQAVQAYFDGDLDEDRLTAIRLQQGVYGQRQEGVNMVRIKLPGGRLSPHQLTGIGEALQDYSAEAVASVTTRQDIQLHTVPLERTPEALRHLARYGLTTREACGNTVRNVTACPLAGVCPREHVDVQSFVQATARRFLLHPLTQHLPRKFKISFSGCEADCAQGMIQDLALVAMHHDGRLGFKVLAGGGLGPKPRKALVIEPFIEEREVLPVVEAVITLHHRYSDRTKRAKSRIKFLVDRFGPEGFIERYREELARTRAAYANESPSGAAWRAGDPGPAFGLGAPRGVLAQKQPGLNVFPIGLPLGDITAAQFHGLAALMEGEGLDDVRTTQDQNLLLLNVPGGRLDTVGQALAQLGLKAPRAGDDVVACPGTWTCRLGITSARTLAQQLDGGASDLRIRVSGCHNGCAQPYVGDIGLHGEGRRIHGKLVPHYRLHFGGNGLATGDLAVKGPEVPSARIQTAVRRVREAYEAQHRAGESFAQWSRARPADYFDELLADLTEVSLADLPRVSRDHGDTAPFRVLQLGGGECAGAKHQTVEANFTEAANERSYRHTFLLARKHDQAIECVETIARLVGRALLFGASGNDQFEDLEDIAAALQEALPDHPRIAAQLSEQAAQLAALRTGFDEAEFKRLAREQDRWTVHAAALCRQWDHQLNLSGALPAVADDMDIAV